MPLTKTVYAAVRQTQYGEWADTDTIDVTAEGTRLLAEDEEKLLPSWTAENPVIRIGRFKMVEEE